MKIELGKITTVGEARVAAVTGYEFDKHNLRNTVFSHGQKTPLAVLVCRSGELRAFHLTGEEMPLDELDRLCPEARGLMGEVGGIR